MNYLILSNPARLYNRVFNAVAERLKSEGHQVVIAADCEYSHYINDVASLEVPSYIFSRYFQKGEFDQSRIKEFSKFNLNSALLSDFERVYAFSLHRNLGADYFDRLKAALVSFFCEIFEKHNIDAVVFENISGIYAHIAWYVCQEKGKTYFGVSSSRLPGRFSFKYGPFDDAKALDGLTNEILSGDLTVPHEVRHWSSDYIAGIEKITPDYMKFNGSGRVSLLSNKDWPYKLRIAIGALRHAFQNSLYAFTVGNPVNYRWQFFVRAMKRKFRVMVVPKYFDHFRSGEKYLLYPLHYHPESSTSVLCGTYLNEYEVIRNIAFNLPEGVRLYVKDHPSAHGYASWKFYRDVSRLPNVRLLLPSTPTKALVKASLAVITLTSTVGYEALLLGKRVFLFGNVFYELHKNVVKIQDPTRLFEYFTEWLDRPLAVGEEYNQAFVEAYYLSSMPGVFNVGAKSHEEFINAICGHICH